MLTRFTLIAILISSFTLVKPTLAQQFNRGDIDFNGPNKAWVITPRGESVGYMVIRNRENSFRIDVFDDGGRFLIRSYCEENRRSLKNIRSVVIMTDGDIAHMRDCNGEVRGIRRPQALNALFGILPKSVAPPAIDIYLVQLLHEYQGYGIHNFQ